MPRLINETKDAIEQFGLTPDNITYIGSAVSGHQCSWEEFCQLADRYYDAGYGSQKVASDLVILFEDGRWLQRHEYDGAEAWECVTPFTPPAKKPKKIRRVVIQPGDDEIGWRTLKQLNSKR